MAENFTAVIPGLRQQAHLGTTFIESSNDAIHAIVQTGDKTGRGSTCACQKNVSGEKIAGEEGSVKT